MGKIDDVAAVLDRTLKGRDDVDFVRVDVIERKRSSLVRFIVSKKKPIPSPFKDRTEWLAYVVVGVLGIGLFVC